MSGQSARIWLDLVAGFSARRRARRVRDCIAQSAEFVSSSFPGTEPLITKRLPKADRDGIQERRTLRSGETALKNYGNPEARIGTESGEDFLTCGRMLRRSVRIAQLRLIELTPTENGTWSWSTLQRAIIHAEGVFVGGGGGSRRYHPRRRRAVWLSIIRAEARKASAYRVGAMRWSLWRRYWK